MVIIYYLVNKYYFKKVENEFINIGGEAQENKKPKILNDLKEEPSEIFDSDWGTDTDFDIDKHVIKDPYGEKTLDDFFKEKNDTQSLDDDIKNLLN